MGVTANSYLHIIADEKVYENLPGCCQYERRDALEKDHGQHGQKH